jgi:hypothetical protein
MVVNLMASKTQPIQMASVAVELFVAGSDEKVVLFSEFCAVDNEVTEEERSKPNDSDESVGVRIVELLSAKVVVV